MNSNSRLTKFTTFILTFFFAFGLSNINAQDSMSDVPIFGAQVFIEPGQTEEDIDLWFQRLSEHGMKSTRIRMFESYMRQHDGSWDFSLFDKAFKAAEKYDIKVYATIFPYTEKTDIGGFKFPRDKKHLQSIAEFIENLVTHFSQFSSMYAWVLINEPGVGGYLPDTEFTRNKYEKWLDENPSIDFKENGYPVLVDLQDERFLLDFNTWYLNWLAKEVRKYDMDHIIHVNNHALFQNAAEYDYPEWRKFLDTVGGSAHAAWHFGYFNRNQYAMAMSAYSSMMRNSAGDLPWIMTELQGGNNLYSVTRPLVPSYNEVAQWMWIIIGSQGKGGIFWTLNPRASGIEAGEWAMLNFQNEPSDRLNAVADVMNVIDSNQDLFANARTVDSDINLIYIRESMWAEKKKINPTDERYEGLEEGGVMKSMLGYYETLSEMGVNINIKEIGEFDFTKEEYSGSTIILAHQISVPTRYVSKLENFVERGGKLLVEGLTAYLDEDVHNTMITGFLFADLFGGNISEFKFVDNLFDFNWGQSTMPSHLWRGYINNETAEIVSTYNDQAIATRNQFGEGEVLWIPSLIGLGSRISDNYELSKLLSDELKLNLDNSPFKFASHEKGVLMKTLISGNSYITIVVNKSNEKRDLEISANDITKSPHILFADSNGTISDWTISISPDETMVIVWQE